MLYWDNAFCEVPVHLQSQAAFTLLATLRVTFHNICHSYVN